MIRTLALRSSSLADKVYELSEQALDQAQLILFDALTGGDKTARLQAAKVLLTRTARPESGAAGGRSNLRRRQRQTNRACDAMAEKSRRLARNRTPRRQWRPTSLCKAHRSPSLNSSGHKLLRRACSASVRATLGSALMRPAPCPACPAP
jgi:hypothetical protein